MSRKANCWDNAVAEYSFSNVKKKRVKKQIYKNRDLARRTSPTTSIASAIESAAIVISAA